MQDVRRTAILILPRGPYGAKEGEKGRGKKGKDRKKRDGRGNKRRRNNHEEEMGH